MDLNRFKQLLESTMGNVKPLLSEQESVSQSQLYQKLTQDGSSTQTSTTNQNKNTSTDTDQSTTTNQDPNKVVTGKVKLVGSFKPEQVKNIEFLIKEMENIGIKNPYTQIGMLSVISKETNFIPKSEGGQIGYCTTSNERIRKLFGKRVPESDAELNALKCDTKKFFNKIYANIVGNQGGDDGWVYRGRGFNQLTGINNYRKYSKKIGMGDELVKNPDLLNQPDIAAKVALAFLTKGKSASTFPNFTNKEDAAIFFADVNSGGGVSSHRPKALEASKKFDVTQ